MAAYSYGTTNISFIVIWFGAYISASVIKRNSDLFSFPLTLLFNQSIATGTFPAVLKTAKVTPIHKNGPTNDPQNYRPISQLKAFSKIFRKINEVTFVTLH